MVRVPGLEGITGFDGSEFRVGENTVETAAKIKNPRGWRAVGSGFQISFEKVDTKFDRLNPFERLRQDAVEIRGASIDAVVETTDTIKNRIRAYINAHFTGSEWHSNNNRRVANASAQSKIYDELDSKGQYAGLVYSKFGVGGPAGFE